MERAWFSERTVREQFHAPPPGLRRTTDRLERRVLTQLTHRECGELGRGAGDPRIHLRARLGQILARALREDVGSEGYGGQEERSEHPEHRSHISGVRPARLCVTVGRQLGDVRRVSCTLCSRMECATPTNARGPILLVEDHPDLREAMT